MKNIFEIVVISGKGGTGKTCVSSALATIGGGDLILVDCDVDAPDLHLVMSPNPYQKEDFYAGELAKIDQGKCVACGKCQEICAFAAIQTRGDAAYWIDPFGCEGCGYCARVCPAQAIENLPRLTGKVLVSEIKTGTTMVHANLDVGGENSGKLVAELKNRAKKIAVEKKQEMVLVDGSPGIGCPVVSSLSGASLVLLVVEPTVSGLHDLKRVLELVQKFHLRSTAIINKADINAKITAEIELFLSQQDVPVLAHFPYDKAFSKAITKGRSVVETSSDYRTKFAEIYKQIKSLKKKL